MAAGIVLHSITTSAGVSFTVASWVPNTATPDVGAVPIALPSDGTNVAIISAAGALKVDNSAVTQPVTGTVTANVGTGLDKGAGAATAATLRATIDTGQLGALVKGAVPTVSGGNNWFWYDVSQTNAAIQNTTGAAGDYLESVLCIVATAATSQVSIKDGSGTARVIFPANVGGGVGSYPVPIGAVSKLGAWQISTQAGVTAIVTGKFT